MTDEKIQDEGVSTVAEFLEWVRECRDDGKGGERAMIYRGLADEGWAVEAASYRRLRESIISKNSDGVVHDTLFAVDNKRLLEKARMEKYCTVGNDLEILAKLQHDGAATCLVDFTTQPLIALWFACQFRNEEKLRNEEPFGKVVTLNREQYTLVTLEEMKKKEISNFLYPKKGKPKLRIWEPPGQNNNRIIVQQSVFVFGLPKIPIKKNDSCIVKNKEKILKELQNIGISAESIFRDYAGFILLNKHDKVYENWPVDGTFYSGLINYEIREFKLAIKCYDQAAKLDPKNSGIYNNRGNAKSKSGLHKEAIVDYDKAIRLDPKDAMAYNNRGNGKAALKRYEEAIVDYDEAIRLDPKDAMVYNNRGLAKCAFGLHKEGIVDFDEAIRLGLKDANTYINRGAAKYEMGHHKEGIVDFDEAIKLEPKNANAYNNRGNVKYALGRYEDAIVDFDEAIRLEPKDANGYNNRGLANHDLERYEDAIVDFDEAIRLEPKNANGYNNRGVATFTLGLHKEAIVDYDEAIRLDPKDAVAHYNRCESKAEVGDMVGALADWRKAKELAPDDERFVCPPKFKVYLESKGEEE